MSYDINLLDPVTKEVIEFDFPHQIKGPYAWAYKSGWLNVIQYSRFYYNVLVTGYSNNIWHDWG